MHGHLTNYSLNKRADKFVKCKEGVRSQGDGAARGGDEGAGAGLDGCQGDGAGSGGGGGGGGEGDEDKHAGDSGRRDEGVMFDEPDEDVAQARAALSCRVLRFVSRKQSIATTGACVFSLSLTRTNANSPLHTRACALFLLLVHSLAYMHAHAEAMYVRTLCQVETRLTKQTA